jgi:hypothetical protein
MKNLPNFQRVRGQALLVVLLGMSVALSVVLSIVARTVTDIGISKSQDESIRAFNAAEAGVEEAIIGSVSSGDTYTLSESGAEYTPVLTTKASTELSDGTWEFDYPTNLSAGESASFWFVKHITDPDTNEEKLTCQGDPKCPQKPTWITICWGEYGTNPSYNTTPAIEVEVYYNSTTGIPLIWDTNGDFSAIRVARTASDPYTSRATASNFEGLSPASQCQYSYMTKKYAFARRIFLSSGGGGNDAKVDVPNWNSMDRGSFIVARVRIFFNTDKAQPVGIITQATLPAQGVLIESTGVSGETYRKLNLFQGYAEPPFAFNSAVFSGTDISK